MTLRDDASEPLLVLLVDSDEDRARIVRSGLDDRAIVQQANSDGAGALLDVINKLQPDVIIIDCESPSRDIIENLRTLSREHPKPIVMFVEEDDGVLAKEAVRAGVSAYIVDGLATSRVRPVVDIAIERFSLFDSMRRELEKSKADLAARKVIERAKGLLMERKGLSEKDAYDAMRRMAMTQGKTLKDVAENILSVVALLSD